MLKLPIHHFRLYLKLQASQTEQKIEATGAQIDRMAGSQSGTAKAATTIGGYSELHLNQPKNQKPGGTDKDEIDFHRFVLFVGTNSTSACACSLNWKSNMR